MKQKFTLPLINAHTHAAMIGFRGIAEDIPLKKWLEEHIWPAEAKSISPAFIYKQAKKAILEMKKNGIQAFSDMYFFEDFVAKAAKELKMHAVIGEGILDFPTPYAKTPREGLKITEDLIKKYRNDPYIDVAVAPHSIYTVSEKILIDAKKLARKYKKIYHIHLAETRWEFDECRKKHNLTPVEYLDKLNILDKKTTLAHCVWLTDKDMDILAKRKTHVIHCPLSNLKLGSGIAPISKLIQKGVNVALGTDGAASSNRLDIWEAGKYTALLQKGVNTDSGQIPAKDAIGMMTVNGLVALGIREIGNKSLQDIKTAIKKQKNFNFLYELNVEQLKF